jgi:membrane-associated protease RseP (regulator of RpoE activity)
MSVLAAIAVLAVLVFVHELGHFLAARLQGIHVNRFSIGFGPVVWKYQGSETEYAVRGFPLGGYVGFPDDDPDCEIPADDPNLFKNRPVLDRAIVISAGVIANLVFAYLLLVTQLGVVGIPQASQPGVLIPEVSTAYSRVAVDAGIKSGDVVLQANDQRYDTSLGNMNKLKDLIKTSPDQVIHLTLRRDTQTLELDITPSRSASGKGIIGVQLQQNGKIIRRRAHSVVEVLQIGANEFEQITVATVQGFGQLISNFQETASQVAGPVKIVEIGSKLASESATSLFQFAALISVNLAILNSLPLPALDGGQLLFLVIEGLRGRPLPAKVQDGIMQTGLVFLLSLGAFLILRDTAQLFQQ